MRTPGSAAERQLLRPRTWSLRTRLAAVSTVAVVAGLSIAGVTAYVVTSRLLYEQIDDSLREAPVAISDGEPAGVPNPADMCNAIESPRGPSPGLFTVALLLPDGDVCADPDAPAVEIQASDYDAGPSPRLRDGQLENGNAARVAVVDTEDGNVLVMARDTQSIVNVLNTLKLTLVAVTILGAGLALAVSRWTSGAGLRPITRFAVVAERIAATGNLDEQVERLSRRRAVGSGDELDRLERSFDTMTRVLADAQMRQRRLVADAGHELRTPLSSLRNNISLLHKSRRIGRSLPGEDEDRLLADLSTQVDELSLLVDDLSALASPDSDHPPFDVIRFDDCVERAVQRARSRSSDHEIRVDLSPSTVLGDPADLERAAVNLLDNALKFSPAGSVVEVVLQHGRLDVADRGPGVSDDDAARAFERFWRSSRARSLPGSGLGLSIVDDVARHHGGWTRLAPRPGGGTIATLFVPEIPGA